MFEVGGQSFVRLDCGTCLLRDVMINLFHDCRFIPVLNLYVLISLQL